MKADIYRVATNGAQVLIHKKVEGQGELKRVQTLNTVMDSGSLLRLQEAFNGEASALIEKIEKVEGVNSEADAGTKKDATQKATSVSSDDRTTVGGE